MADRIGVVYAGDVSVGYFKYDDSAHRAGLRIYATLGALEEALHASEEHRPSCDHCPVDAVLSVDLGKPVPLEWKSSCCLECGTILGPRRWSGGEQHSGDGDPFDIPDDLIEQLEAYLDS